MKSDRLRHALRHPAAPNRAWALGVLLLASGCASDLVGKHGMEPPAVASPRPTFSDMTERLICLGDKLRAQKLTRHVFGIGGIVDATGKLGVDLMSYARDAGSVIASRGGNVYFTTEGVGGNVRQEQPGIEERKTLLNAQRARHLEEPRLQLTGGVRAFNNAFYGHQNSFGINTKVFDAARSTSTTVDMIEMSFGLKDAPSGVDLAMRAVSLQASVQTVTTADDAGLLVTARLDGRRKEAGVRAGRSSTLSQLPSTAAQLIVEEGMAQIIAGYFAVDMADCPSGKPAELDFAAIAAQADKTPGKDKLTGEPLPSLQELGKLYAAMSEPERVRWLQGRLQLMNYAPGDTDGVVGPKTRQAVLRLAQDLGLSSNGQPSDLLYLALARRELARGHDPRKPPAPRAQVGIAEVQIRLARPAARFALKEGLRASLVVPQAGYVNCWLVTPQGMLAVLPMRHGRGSNFATAHAAISLPGHSPRDEDLPRIGLTVPGEHTLWCGLARHSLQDRLPEPMRNEFQGQVPLEALRKAYVDLAGADLLAVGVAPFEVVDTSGGK